MANRSNKKSNENSLNRIKSIKRAFGIIETLHSDGCSGVTKIANELDMPKSTVHAYLNTLVDTGYVVKNNNEYRLSYQFLKLGGGVRDRQKLYHVSAPLLRDLAAESGEIGHLSVEENGWGVLLFKAESPRAVDDNAHIGQHVSLHCTAMGKAILSTYSDKQIQHIVEKRGMRKFTSSTLTDLNELLDEVESIRRSGVAFNYQERSSGVNAIAVPLLSVTDDIVGAISLSGPRARMSEERMANELADQLIETKDVIELKIEHY